MINGLKTFADRKGVLVPIEHKNIPFEVKRTFYVCGVPEGQERGMHAHYTTQQYLICAQGRIEVKLFDGKETKHHMLEQHQGIFVDAMVWDSQIFHTGNDILVALCSTEYDLSDYILDIEEFKKKVIK
jgi:dTDP-4-dehydrorhamnose 3,5-epimerase-like enzyme